MPMKVLITSDTYLKALPTQASKLREKNLPNQLVNVRAGTTLEIIDHAPYEGQPDSTADDHIFVQLKQPIQGYEGIRWFIHGLHAQVEGTEPNNNPKEDPSPTSKTATVSKSKTAENQPPDYGSKISIPGISRPVGINEPIYFEPTPKQGWPLAAASSISTCAQELRQDDLCWRAARLFMVKTKNRRQRIE